MTNDHFAGDDRSNWQRMLDGDPYIADGPEFAEASRRATRLSDAFHRAVVDVDPGSRELLEELLGHLGEDADVRPPLCVDYGSRISIGARSFVNFNLTALDVAPITIGEDCWLGGGVIVCPGVTIGDRSIIAAGSVVTRDIPSDCLAAGNPAVVKRHLRTSSPPDLSPSP